jgi:hypothetical protein
MATRTVPWKQPKPKTASKTKLAPKYKMRAKAAAARAGRRYPNLVDNMRAAREQREAEAESKAGNKNSPSAREKKKARAD